MAGHYRLTDKQVQNAAPKAGQAKLKLQDGAGLTLVARAKERKYWTLRVVADGKTREVGMGSAAGAYAVSLADARDKAFELRKLLREGVAFNDALARVTKRKALRIAGSQPTAGGMTFEQHARAYIQQHHESWKSAVHARQWATTLEMYAFDIIGAKSPGDVTTADVVAILKRDKDKDGNLIGGTLWNTMPETASRLRGRIEKIIAAFKVTSGQQDKFNPAQWTGHLDAVFPKKSKVRKVEHHAALPYAEVPALMKELGKRDGVAAFALKFLILTAGRTGEVLGARWSEINIGKRRWSIPAERMKMEREHVVPLSDAALTVLDEAKRHRVDGNDAVFPGGTWVDDEHATMSNMALLVLLKRLRQPREEEPKGWTLKDDCTAHGFRSSFRDWAADNGEDRELAEAALAHTIGGVERAYRRTQMVERRAGLMQRWGDYVCPPVAGGKVIAMTGRKRKTS